MVKIYLTQQQTYLDIDERESVILNSSIKEIQDINLIQSEFSSEFEVPASKTNNKAFEHYYRADILGIDGNEFIECKIFVDNIEVRTGKLIIEGVNVENNVPTSYDLRYYDDLAKLKTRLNNDLLSELNTSYLNTTMNHASQVFNGYPTDTEAIVYPLTSIKSRFIYNPSSTAAADTLDNTKNIAYASGPTTNENYAIDTDDIVPAMAVGEILQLIEDKYDLSFTGVVRQDHIRSLYMYLNQEEKSLSGHADDTKKDGFLTTLTLLNGATYTIGEYDQYSVTVPAQDETYYYVVETTPTFSASSTDAFTYQLNVNGKVVEATSTTGTTLTHTLDSKSFITTTSFANSGGISCTSAITIKQYNKSDDTLNDSWNFSGICSTSIYTQLIMKRRFPQLSVLDFIKSIFQMFNIVAEVNGTTIHTYFYDQYIANGTEIDITKYAHIEGVYVSPVEGNSAVEFKHKDSNNAISIGYKETSGREYGSLSWKKLGVSGERLKSNSTDIHLKTSILPLEPVKNLNIGQFTSIVHSSFLDNENKTQRGGATFTYVVRSSGNDSVAVRTSLGVAQCTDFMEPSNIYSGNTERPKPTSVDELPAIATYFGAELNEHNVEYNWTENGLFSNYYSGLVSKLFDAQARTTKLKATLPLSVLINLQLNSTLVVGDRKYIINKYSTRLNDGVTQFELINLAGGVPSEFQVICETITPPAIGSICYSYMDTDGTITYECTTSTKTVCSVGGVHNVSTITDSKNIDGNTAQRYSNNSDWLTSSSWYASNDTSGGGSPSNTNPYAPTNGIMHNIGQNSASLTFSGYSDAEDSNSQLEFNIYLDGSLIATGVSSNGASTTYTFTGLDPATQYEYDVETVDTGNLVSVTQYTNTFTTADGGGA